MNTPLHNDRQEKFALALFKGMTKQAAAIEAGYKPSRARFTGYKLATYRHIQERIKEMHELARSDAVMPVIERKERLSEIARARLSDFIEVKEDGSISKVNIKGGHSAAIQEVTVTEFVGGPEGRAKDRSTKVKLHDPVKSMAELSKLDGAYPAANVLKLEVEPGEEMGKVLENLLRGLRGYTPPETPPADPPED